MMSNNDPRTIQHLIADRQHFLLEEAGRSRRPSSIRVAAGMALIRFGEALRGHSQVSRPGSTLAAEASPFRRLRPA